MFADLYEVVVDIFAGISEEMKGLTLDFSSSASFLYRTIPNFSFTDTVSVTARITAEFPKVVCPSNQLRHYHWLKQVLACLFATTHIALHMVCDVSYLSAVNQCFLKA